jgi:hypothetical protein
MSVVKGYTPTSVLADATIVEHSHGFSGNRPVLCAPCCTTYTDVYDFAAHHQAKHGGTKAFLEPCSDPADLMMMLEASATLDDGELISQWPPKPTEEVAQVQPAVTKTLVTEKASLAVAKKSSQPTTKPLAEPETTVTVAKKPKSSKVVVGSSKAVPAVKKRSVDGALKKSNVVAVRDAPVAASSAPPLGVVGALVMAERSCERLEAWLERSSTDEPRLAFNPEDPPPDFVADLLAHVQRGKVLRREFRERFASAVKSSAAVEKKMNAQINKGEKLLGAMLVDKPASVTRALGSAADRGKKNPIDTKK